MPALLLLPLILGACSSQPSTTGSATDAVMPAVSQAPVVAFVGVNVIPMDEERVLENQTVVVRGGRIETVGPADEVEVPNGAERIDGDGRYLIPGLAEMHGHIPPPSDGAEYIDDVLFLYVANGITTVRGMLGHDGQLALRDRVNGSDAWAPNLYLAGPSFSGGSIDSPEQAEAKVRQQVEEGWDLLKVHPGLSLAEYDAMAETANELGIRFGGHVPADVGLEHAIEMNQETYDHIDGYIAYLDGESLYGVAGLETLRNLPELQYMPPGLVEGWISTHEGRLANPDRDAQAAETRIANRMRLLEALSDGGALILMGTDAPQQFSVPGFSIHRELARMAEAGMTPYEILVSGSRNVGTYFANEDTFGTIAPGQRADLILLESNPLEDIARVADRAGVMVRGYWISEDEIQDRLDQIADRYEEQDG